MKRTIGAITLCLVMALLVFPAAPASGQLARNVDKAIYPGTTTIQYAGQTLVFSTSAYLKVSLKMLTLTQIEMTVRTLDYNMPQELYGTSSLTIEWVNFNETVYSDNPPAVPWTGVLDTEAGWTEK